MSLRTRLTLAGGGAVFVALAIASLVIYFDVRSKLHDQVDVSLIQSAEGVATKWALANSELPSTKTRSAGKLTAGAPQVPTPPKPPLKLAALAFGKDASGLFQVVPNVRTVANAGLSATGAPVPTATAPSSTALDPKLLAQDEAVAKGLSPPYFRDLRFAGAPHRLYTMRLPSAATGWCGPCAL